ncbi:MAG TPA: alpha/beta fold hydrolase, partial [Rugosimonospora sp.]|nr:alpha/beta fold hydrolase [Rugosimonospora sp.]
MATFVLVHGGRHGGWCWRKLDPLLRSAGHEVYRPSLTGLGDRAHLLGRFPVDTPIDLDTHVADITGLLTFEDLTDVVLVGHSYGGMVITGIADLIPQRLRHVVFLDAFMPKDGESLMDIASDFE